MMRTLFLLVFISGAAFAQTTKRSSGGADNCSGKACSVQSIATTTGSGNRAVSIVSGSTIDLAGSSGKTLSYDSTSGTVSSAVGINVPSTTGKVCFDGTTCGAYRSYNSSQGMIDYISGGVSFGVGGGGAYAARVFDLQNGIRNTQGGASTVFVNDGDGLQLSGVATGSLATCASSLSGTIDWDTTVKAFKVCSNRSGSYAWEILTAGGDSIDFGGYAALATTDVAISQHIPRRSGTVVAFSYSVTTAGANGGVSSIPLLVRQNGVTLCSLTITCASGVGTSFQTSSCSGAYNTANNIEVRWGGGGGDCSPIPFGNFNVQLLE